MPPALSQSFLYLFWGSLSILHKRHKCVSPLVRRNLTLPYHPHVPYHPHFQYINHLVTLANTKMQENYIHIDRYSNTVRSNLIACQNQYRFFKIKGYPKIRKISWSRYLVRNILHVKWKRKKYTNATYSNRNLKSMQSPIIYHKSVAEIEW